MGRAGARGQRMETNGGRAVRREREGEREKVRRIDLLSWIRDLAADGPQGLEAVTDGVDVGHAHEHHLTVGVVLCARRYM